MPATHQSIKIRRPIAEVWKLISNFHDLSWAPNVVVSNENTGTISSPGIGAKRLLNGAFHETLQTFDNDAHSFSYSIDDGPSPVSKHDVSNYIGAVQLNSSEDGGTEMVWSSSWESDSDDAIAFCQAIYVALLDDLKLTLA